MYGGDVIGVPLWECGDCNVKRLGLRFPVVLDVPSRSPVFRLFTVTTFFSCLRRSWRTATAGIAPIMLRKFYNKIGVIFVYCKLFHSSQEHGSNQIVVMNTEVIKEVNVYIHSLKTGKLNKFKLKFKYKLSFLKVYIPNQMLLLQQFDQGLNQENFAVDFDSVVLLFVVVFTSLCIWHQSSTGSCSGQLAFHIPIILEVIPVITSSLTQFFEPQET
ncbi:hypothetical protein AGLY_002632 [Aphis glycines]|uniref:Uncharacterized protein n=1 Tax=Aphis glycines TaxID=307491 RepID=A0A6G0U0T3_APHGL|nr:hypothetical protein AGLY_002632 [Aphis glycines]